MKVSWRDLELFDSDGYRLPYDERLSVLTTWRQTSRLPRGYAFGPMDLPHEEPGGYGPQVPAEVDWADFPTVPGDDQPTRRTGIALE